MHITPRSLPDNPVIPQISPPAYLSPSPTANEAVDTLRSLNHGYKWYKYNNPNHLPINGRVHAKQWRFRRPSGDTISENCDVNREFSPLGVFMSFSRRTNSIKPAYENHTVQS